MVNIRLLGGASKAMGGKGVVKLDIEKCTVSHLLSSLSGSATIPSLLDIENIIIALNGTDIMALEGLSTQIRNDDNVTIVTVIHGG